MGKHKGANDWELMIICYIMMMEYNSTIYIYICIQNFELIVIYDILIRKPLKILFPLPKPWHLVSFPIFEAVGLLLLKAFHVGIMKSPLWKFFSQSFPQLNHPAPHNMPSLPGLDWEINTHN